MKHLCSLKVSSEGTQCGSFDVNKNGSNDLFSTSGVRKIMLFIPMHSLAALYNELIFISFVMSVWFKLFLRNYLSGAFGVLEVISFRAKHILLWFPWCHLSVCISRFIRRLRPEQGCTSCRHRQRLLQTVTIGTKCF